MNTNKSHFLLNRNVYLLFGFLLLELTFSAFQKTHASELTDLQLSRRVKGRVIDTNGEPIAYALIEGVGIHAGTRCDGEGRFSISIDGNGEEKITFSSLGKRPETILPADLVRPEEVIVILSDDIFPIDEVIVTGYSEEKQKYVSGSVVQLNISEVCLLSQPSVDKMLTGQILGVGAMSSS